MKKWIYYIPQSHKFLLQDNLDSYLEENPNHSAIEAFVDESFETDHFKRVPTSNYLFRTDSGDEFVLSVSGNQLMITDSEGQVNFLGQQGPQGDTGLQGEVGPQGPQGLQGIQGEVGLTGFGLYAFAVTDQNGNLKNSSGLTVVKASNGTYDYSFLQPLPNSNYSIVGLPYGSSNDTNVHISNITSTGFRLQLGAGDNGKQDDVLVSMNHCVNVFGYAGPSGISSAYQSWLNVGNTGSEQDFLNSLVGPSGPSGSGAGKSLVLSFGEGGAVSKSLDWYRVGVFSFTGTQDFGNIDTVKAVVKCQNPGKTGEIRLYNLTEAITIASAVITNTNEEIVLLSVENNFPSLPSILEVQIRFTGSGSSKEIYCYSLEIIGN